MCQLSSEGGRRCADYERLKACTASDFAPDPVEGVPDVVWRKDDLQELWTNEPDGRASLCAALMVMEQAKAQEPETTRAVMNAAAASGSECAHLEQRMKSPQSLVRKIRTEQELSAENGASASPEQIAGEMKDVIRYTVIHRDHSQLANVTVGTVRSLQQQGWDIRKIKSTYADGAPYKGIHVQISGTAPDGMIAEVQVHSTDSLEVKNQNHEAYEIYRDITKSKRERREARAECVRRSSTLPTIKGLDMLTATNPDIVSES